MGLDKIEVEHDSVVNGIEMVPKSITYLSKDQMMMEESQKQLDSSEVVQVYQNQEQWIRKIENLVEQWQNEIKDQYGVIMYTKRWSYILQLT